MNVKYFDNWIEKQEQSALIHLSARIALRSLPLLLDVVHKDLPEVRKNVILPLFRACLSSSKQLYRTGRTDDNETVDSAAAYSEFGPYSKNPASGAAGAISRSFRIFQGSEDLELVRFNSRHTVRHYRSACKNVHGESSLNDADNLLIADLKSISTNHKQDFAGNEILYTPKEPDWNTYYWNNLREYLIQYREENWNFWVDWWEDRRDGKPYNIEMEREIVLIPDEDWERGPAHVNAMIAEIRARYAADDTPADNPIAPRFETVNGQIALRTDTPDEPPTDDQAALYDALHGLTVELSALCPENSNRYGLQGKAVGKFLSALGADYGSMHPGALWLAGQSLRRFERADTAKRAVDDPEDEPMEPDQGALFEEVVTTYNVFSTGEPKLKELDEKGRDPATLVPDKTEEARVVRAAVGEASILFDDSVPYVLDQVIEETTDPVEGVRARGVVLTRETFENLLGAAVRKAHSEPRPERSEFRKGAGGAAGALAVTTVAAGTTGFASAFIAVNEAALIALVADTSSAAVWTAIIKSIAARWTGFV